MTESIAALASLLAESVRLWRVPARVEHDNAGVTVASLGARVDVTRAAPDLPYRWMVTVCAGSAPARQRPALSVISVLRQVRLALDPGYAKERLRVSAPPMLPPSPDAVGGAS